MKKLCDVYRELGKPRQTVQSWVTGIFGEENKNKTTFTDEEVLKLWQVCFFKEISNGSNYNYTISHIMEIINSPDYDLNKIMGDIIPKLYERMDEIEKLINVAEFIKNSGMTPVSVNYAYKDIPNMSFDLTMALSSHIGAFVMDNEDLKEKINNIYSKLDFKAQNRVFKKIMDNKKQNLDYYSEQTQRLIKDLHMLYYEVTGESCLAFYRANQIMAPGSEFANKADNRFGKDSAKYFIDAIEYYFAQNMENPVDMEFYEAIANLSNFSQQNYSVVSMEVMEQINRIRKYYEGVGNYNENLSKGAIRCLVNIFKEPVFLQAIDSDEGEADEITFIANAAKYYLDNWDYMVEKFNPVKKSLNRISLDALVDLSKGKEKIGVAVIDSICADSEKALIEKIFSDIDISKVTGVYMHTYGDFNLKQANNLSLALTEVLQDKNVDSNVSMVYSDVQPGEYKITLIYMEGEKNTPA